MTPFWWIYLACFSVASVSALLLFAEQHCLGSIRTTTTLCDVSNVSADLQVYITLAVALLSLHVYGIFVASETKGRLYSYLGPLAWASGGLAVLLLPVSVWVTCAFLAIADVAFSFYVMNIYNWSAPYQPISDSEEGPRDTRDIPTKPVYISFIATSGIILVLLDTITGLAFINASPGANEMNVALTIVLLCLKIAFVDLGLGVWLIAGLQSLCFRKYRTYLRNGAYYLSVERGASRAAVSAFFFRRYLVTDGNRSVRDAIAIFLLVDMSINLFVSALAFVVRFKIFGLDSFDWDTLKQLRFRMLFGNKLHLD